MREPFQNSYEIASMILGLIALIVMSLFILVGNLLVILPVLIVEALKKFTQLFQSQNQTM